jgi:hypothetical protein
MRMHQGLHPTKKRPICPSIRAESANSVRVFLQSWINQLIILRTETGQSISIMVWLTQMEIPCNQRIQLIAERLARIV